jgi:hypothetical protein
MLSVILLSVILLMLNSIMLNAIMQNVFMLSSLMHSVMGPNEWPLLLLVFSKLRELYFSWIKVKKAFIIITRGLYIKTLVCNHFYSKVIPSKNILAYHSKTVIYRKRFALSDPLKYLLIHFCFSKNVLVHFPRTLLHYLQLLKWIKIWMKNS